MTDLDRLRDAVVQALKGVMQAPLPPGKHTTSGGVVFVPLVEWANVENALAALDAYPTRAPAPAPAQGETVDVALWQATDGLVWWCIPHSRWDEDEGGRDAIRLGTITLPLDREIER